MKIGILWRKNRNIEFQLKLTQTKLSDDAYEEAKILADAISDAGYESALLEWNEDPLIMIQRIRNVSIDMIFNASSYAEVIFLETFGVPYVGTSSKVIGMDKAIRKIIVTHFGVNTSEFKVIEDSKNIGPIEMIPPLFVKPLNGRGSTGIDENSIVDSLDQLPSVVARITEGLGQPALIESFIQGRELTVGIIGTTDPEVLPILEIKYAYGRTNTFEHKMLDREIIICPMVLSEESAQRIKAMALSAYKALNILDFGRIDMILDDNDIPWFLEVNTFAGLNMPDDSAEKTAHYGYMGYMAKARGYTRVEFLKKIIQSALMRYHLE